MKAAQDGSLEKALAGKVRFRGILSAKMVI